MTSPGHLRIGLWLDEPRVSQQAYSLVEWAHAQPNVDVIALLVAPPQQTVRPDGVVSTALFRALSAIETAQLGRNARYRDHLKTFDPKELGIETAAVARDSLDPAALQGLKLDLIVCLGTELPPTPLRSCARLGTLAFEWADALHRKGLPIGFWEVFERQDTTAFALRRFDAQSTSSELLLRGQVPTRHYYLLNRAALFDKAHHHLRVVLSRLASTGRWPNPQASSRIDRPPRGYPSAAQSLAYLRRHFAAMIHKKLAKLRGRDAHWQVSFVRSDWRDAALQQARPIDNPPGRYLADPFVIRRTGRDYCFVEDFDCATQRGAISAYELGAERAERVGIAIDEPFHMSFPFLFEHGGALFMCPETSANRDIRVYRCVDFPLGWKLEKILMSGLSAVDTMLFEHGARWWMLTTIDPTQSGEICSELHVFSADSPFADHWTPHAKNPVLFDAACGRNGGLLVDGNDIFRVSQRQGFDRYGKASQINQIMALNDEVYDERCIARIEPTFKPGLLGTHHLHSRDGITVFDSLAEATVRTHATVRP